MKKYLGAAGVFLAACGAHDATAPDGNPVAHNTRSLSVSSGTNLGGFFGNFLAEVPLITLSDQQGHPVANEAVTFSASGGGKVTGASVQTDSLGHAHPLSWRLGTGAQGLTVTAADANDLTIPVTASALPASTFHISVRYAANTTPTEAERAAFDAAAARWSQVLLQGGPAVTVQEPDAGCGDLQGQRVDGLVITAELTGIDGKGKVLGSSGPCILRDQGYLPVQGYMRFDTADVSMLESGGQLDEVILHEMGHVLGFGTIWEVSAATGMMPNAFLMRASSDPMFTGASAIAALLGSSAGLGFPGTGVPVEATGGSGTAYAHWRETTFGSELMTGWLNASAANPLSAVTVDQFRDLGYVVNDAMADGYSLAALVQAYGVQPVAMVEGSLTMPLLVVDRSGHEVRRVQRILR